MLSGSCKNTPLIQYFKHGSNITYTSQLRHTNKKQTTVETSGNNQNMTKCNKYFHQLSMWWSEWEMSSTGSQIWITDPQLVVLYMQI